MRYLVGSDFHLEFHRDGGKSFVKSMPEADGIIVPGDLSNNKLLLESLRLLCQKYSKVVYVPGNHDFYGSDLGSDGLDCLIEAAYQFQNLTILEAGRSCFEDRITIGDTELFGATLWFQQPADIWLREQLADYDYIANFATDIDGWAEKSTFATMQYLAEETDKTKRIVITHHMPHDRSVPKEFIHSRANVFFVNTMMHNYLSSFHLMHHPDRTLPQMWIHGHTHTTCRYRLDQMQVVCNPFGYPREQPTGFDPQFSIEL